MNIRNIIEEDLIKFNNKDYIFEKKNNKYIPIKFNDFINKAKALSSYLIAKGLLNEKILIIGKNSINYMIADLSVTIYTGICVNINRDTKEEDLDYLINYLDIKAIIIALIICILYSISDEIHQLFVSGRAGQVKDVFLDSLGSTTGIIFYYLYYQLRRKKHEQEKTIC